MIILLLNSANAAVLGRLFYLRGSVEVNRGGDRLVAEKGMLLEEGDIISTSRKSLATVTYLFGSKIKIDPLTSIHIRKIRDDKASNGGLKINLLKGSFIMNFINKRKDESVAVEMNDIAIGVRGTHFFAGIGAKGDPHSYVAVKEGQVEVLKLTENDSELVDQGEAIVFEKERGLTRSSRYEWASVMNWGVNNEKRSSLFNQGFMIKTRLEEVRLKIAKLKRRRKRFISKGTRERWSEKGRSDRGKIQRILGRLNETQKTKATRKLVEVKKVEKIDRLEKVKKRAVRNRRVINPSTRRSLNRERRIFSIGRQRPINSRP